MRSFLLSSLLLSIGAVALSSCGGGGGGTGPLQLPPAYHNAPVSGSDAAPATFGSTIFVANQLTGNTPPGTNAVFTFPLSGNGNIAPSGNIPLNDLPQAVAVHDGLLYVLVCGGLTPFEVEIFKPGSQTPASAIGGSNTGFGPQSCGSGLAVDSQGNIYASRITSFSPVTRDVAVFAPPPLDGSTHNVAPVRTITIPSIPADANAEPTIGLATDTADNLYVAVRAVLIFPPNATQNTAPLNVLSGVCAPYFNATNVAVDTDGTIYVANGDTRSVVVLAPGLTGPPVLRALIFGSNTGLQALKGIAVDSSSIYVTDTFSNEVAVFPKTASGNATPSAVISGSNTSLTAPVAVAVSP